MTYEAYARSTDPCTSKDAAAGLSEKALSRLQQQAMEAIQTLGGKAIAERIVAVSGIPIQTLSPRMRPLVRHGMIRESGKEKANSGRMQTVWEITSAGQRALEGK